MGLLRRAAVTSTSVPISRSVCCMYYKNVSDLSTFVYNTAYNINMVFWWLQVPHTQERQTDATTMF